MKSVGTQIEDIFQSGWPALLSRTRRKRSKGHHVTSEEGAGDKGSDEDEEVFDDADFYQQLLRDVIESKGGSGQLMASQTRKKSKKDVDTRASKGRKLRFVVLIMCRWKLANWDTTGTKCRRRYRISWFQLLTMLGGTKPKSTSCLRRCWGRDFS